MYGPWTLSFILNYLFIFILAIKISFKIIYISFYHQVLSLQ